MTKKAHIESLHQKWISKKLSTREIASRVNTTKEYVMQVFSFLDIENEVAKRSFEKESKMTIPGPKEEIIEPDFEWEDFLPKVFRISSESLPKNRSVKPKVNLLPDGKVELIYKSKM